MWQAVDTGAVIRYDRNTLISIGLQSACLLSSFTPDPCWPSEILRRNARKRRARGKRAGARSRLKAHPHHTALPSILLANVQCLENKMDVLRDRVHFHKGIRDCNILCFTETWLNPGVPDHAILPTEFFSVYRVDGMMESGISRGGGVCLMVNSNWCDSSSVATLTRSCTPNLELLTIKCRPFYLPKEFTSVIVSAVYIPPQADTDTTLCELRDALTQHQTRHRGAALIVVGDFNGANLKHAVPHFHQHITCPTKGERILSHCYTPYEDGYKAMSFPPFEDLVSAPVFLIPKYKENLKQEAPVQREVVSWTERAVSDLQDAVDDALWDMIRHCYYDIEM